MSISKNKLSIKSLLACFPPDLWENLAQEYQIDRYVKKLEGKQVCLLLIYAMLKGKTPSLRSLEAYYGSSVFQTYAGIAQGSSIDHSSIAERLTNLKPEYIKALFESVEKQLVEKYQRTQIKGYELLRFDSTLLSLSSKLLREEKEKLGMRNGSKGTKTGKESVAVKFTLGFDGLQTRVAELFCRGNYMNENVALAQVVENHAYEKGQIAVFDRGISKRICYQNLSEAGVIFVSRIEAGAKREIISQKDLSGQDTEKLAFIQEQAVYLFSTKQKMPIPLRIIEAQNKETGQILCFLTNSLDLSAQEVAEIYQRRWDIESFFKFLKQELGIKHFLVRHEKGLYVVLYLALITAMLIYIYQKENKKSSYKIAKIAFFIELEELVIDMLVQEKVKQILEMQT